MALLGCAKGLKWPISRSYSGSGVEGLRVLAGSSSRLFWNICDLMRSCRTSASLPSLDTMRLTTVSAKWVFCITCSLIAGGHSSDNSACT
ncbi:hypothetical protein D3C80_1041650 [compost metagenome]